MSRDRTSEASAGAAAYLRPISAAAGLQFSALCPLPSALSPTSGSVSSPFREPQTDSHPQMKRRFLVQPDLPREIVHELLDQLLIVLVDELFQTLDDVFLALHIGRREQFVLVQHFEQLVILCRALLLDITEARVPHTVVGHLDALRTRAGDVHQIVRSGAHHCLREADYYN